jgi:hypothetical protein
VLRNLGISLSLLLIVSITAVAQPAGRCVIPVTVLDRESTFVPYAGADDFKVKVGDRDARVLSVEKHVPAHVIFLLDSSTSMKQAPSNPRPLQLELLYLLASAAPANVALVEFSDQIEVVLDGREKVLSELTARISGKDHVGGGSQLTTVAQHIAEAMVAEPGDVILAIGAGRSTGASKQSRQQLLETLNNKGIRFFYIEAVVPVREFMSERYIPPPPQFYEVAKKSGGRAGSLAIVPGIDRAFGELKDLLVNDMYRFYRVEVEAPFNDDASRKVEVQFTRAGDSHGKTLTYYPETVTCLKTAPATNGSH